MYNATKSIFEISHNNSYMAFNLVEINPLYGGITPTCFKYS